MGTSRLGSHNTRGAQPDEITLAQFAERIGLGRTQAWMIVVKQGKVPARRDLYQWYIKKLDADAYVHTAQRGKPTTNRTTEGLN